MADCTHKQWRRWPGGEHFMTGEPLQDVVAEESTFEDCGVGRFRCTQCGHVMYYTGLWRDYYEKGVPCFGSEGVPRAAPPALTPLA